MRRATRKARLQLEALEDRLVMSSFTVMSTSDSVSNPAPLAGTGTLRQAIIDANAHSNSGGPDRIVFNLPAADPGHVYYRDDGIAGHVSQSFVAVTAAADDTAIADIDQDWPHSWWSIRPASQLPEVHDPAILDGYTQSGASLNTLAVGNDAVLRIELNGGGGAATDGINLGHDSTVQGLIINGFLADAGIMISGASRAVVQGNFLGTDASGTVAASNDTAVVIDDADSITIGGSMPAARNVISGNTEQGLYIHQSTRTSVLGNYIGTNSAGDQAIANVWFGVNISDASLNNVDGNVISGNGDLTFPYDYGPCGVTMGGFFSSCQYNTVTNNKIGVGADGTTAVPNLSGVAVGGGAQYNTFEGNVIAHNIWQGAQIGPDFLPRPTPTSDNVFRNNEITGNGGNGVEIFAGNGLTYDWLTTLAFTTIPDNGTQQNSILNNNISGNGGIGVIIDGIRGNDNLVYGNTIAGNAGYGVQLSGGAQGNQIGGTGSGQANSIHDNGGAGVLVRNLGYDLNLEFFPGMENGEYIANGPNSPTPNTPTAENVISGNSIDHNTGPGVFIADGPDNRVSANTITGNLPDRDVVILLGSLGGVTTISDVDTLTALAPSSSSLATIHKTGTQITWGSPVTDTVNYVNVAHRLTIDLSSSTNNTVYDPGGPDTTVLIGGPGINNVFIANTVNNGVVFQDGGGTNNITVSLGNLLGPVALNGTTGVNQVTVVGTAGDDAMVLSGNQLQSGGQTIRLAGSIASLTVEGGPGDDSLTISNFTASVASLTVNGGEGANQVTVEGSLPPGVTLDIVSAVRSVQIDVRPQSLNLASNGIITVALFTTASFDATRVDVASVLFAGAHAAFSTWQDADGDGDLDLVLKFRTADTTLRSLYEQLLAEDINQDGVLDSSHQLAQLSLTGQTVEQVLFEGFDQLDLFLSGRALRQMLAELAAAKAI